MALADIPGQELAVKCLTRGLARARITHAYLFTGPEGVGQAEAALALAQALNCPASPREPCGTCNTCRRIAANNYPDVLEVVPEGNNIKIDQIRSLRKDIYFRPYEGKYKVYIISAAQQMTVQAANSLLCILEEPPSYAVLVLLTSQEDRLLPTIVSRCQKVPFYPLSPALMEDKLVGEMGLERERAGVVAALAAGSYVRARELVESGRARESHRRVMALAATICGGNEGERWLLGEEWGKAEELPLFLQQLLFWFRDLLILKETGAEELLLHRGEMPRLRQMAQCYSRRGLVASLEALREIMTLLTSNVNIGLALNVLMGQLEPDLSLTDGGGD
ncbi:MAG: DNA polymerase III subunit delta' [Firmicutes bacterium]|nr:DNA polymerase III subunit delta' [Bacillota bacterium]